MNHQNRVNFPRCKTKKGKLLWMWSGIANIHSHKIHSSKSDGVNVKTRMNHTSYTHSSTCAIFIPINWNNLYADRCFFFFLNCFERVAKNSNKLIVLSNVLVYFEFCTKLVSAGISNSNGKKFDIQRWNFVRGF